MLLLNIDVPNEIIPPMEIVLKRLSVNQEQPEKGKILF
jgi:hypothetical protein